MLKYNPKSRPSIVEVLDHPFFTCSQESEITSPKRFNVDTFDSLKLEKDGIKISKNQVFRSEIRNHIRPAINNSNIYNRSEASNSGEYLSI